MCEISGIKNILPRFFPSGISFLDTVKLAPIKITWEADMVSFIARRYTRKLRNTNYVETAAGFGHLKNKFIKYN